MNIDAKASESNEMVRRMQVSHGDHASVAKHKIALFGTGANLRLSERLPMVICTETAPAGASATLLSRYGYLGFSARTGEVGSLKALRLLFEAALAEAPVQVWQRSDGRYVDALRPTVEPEGLASIDEVRQLHEHHLLAIRRALAETEEVVLVLGGDPTGHDTVSGTSYVCVPNGDFPRKLRDNIQPHFSDLDGMDDDFAAIWQVLRKLRPDVQITLALVPPMPGVTLSRAHQNQLVCLRTLVDEWVWRFGDVNYLPIWDAAMAKRAVSEGDRWELAQSLMNPAGPLYNTPVAAPEADNDDAAEDIMPPVSTDQARRKERRARSRKNGKVPSTICEDELLEAFSK